MNRWSALAVLLAIAGALALRVPKLDSRPLHNDEAVNAVKVSELWQQGRYKYDPDEYHGPALHYATLPFLWLSGARSSDELNDSTLRLAPVVFGVGLILLLLLFADGLGRPAVVWAAVFLAISPAMVFYSRYFIHEMLLVFFTALTIGAGWRLAQTRSARWAVTAGVGLGLMFATKETCVFSIAAMALAAAVVVIRKKKERLQCQDFAFTVFDSAGSTEDHVQLESARTVRLDEVGTQQRAELTQRIATKLREEFGAEGKGELFDAMTNVKPGKNSDREHAEICVRFGMTPETMRRFVFRLRTRFGELLRAEEKATTNTRSTLADAKAGNLPLQTDFVGERWRHAGLSFVAALIVWLLLFSSFFTNFAGLLDSFLTYLPWLQRAGGHSPHIHPWSFYLERLAWFHPAKGPTWSEGLILILAAVGVVISFAGKKPLHCFLALYTIILTTIYALIPYKTPWCLLNFYLGMILLAGVGAAALVEFFQARPLKLAAVTVLLGLTAQLTWQAWRANFVYAADRRNPYVYAQTVPNLLELVQRTEGLSRVAPEGYETVVKVIAPEGDYWPLPWYLRRFKHIGWYDRLPNDAFAPIIIVSSKLDARLDEKSDKKWLMVGLTELRPGKFFELYVELELWKKYVETLPRPEE